MYINNMPFSETLHMAQRDLYDINVLLLKPLTQESKKFKRKKFAWRTASAVEHMVGVSFGVLAAIEIYNQNYIMGGLYCGLMAIGATVGFDANKNAKSCANSEKQTNKMIETTNTLINTALPERLHEIAEIARNKKQR